MMCSERIGNVSWNEAETLRIFAPSMHLVLTHSRQVQAKMHDFMGDFRVRLYLTTRLRS